MNCCLFPTGTPRSQEPRQSIGRDIRSLCCMMYIVVCLGWVSIVLMTENGSTLNCPRPSTEQSSGHDEDPIRSDEMRCNEVPLGRCVDAWERWSPTDANVENIPQYYIMCGFPEIGEMLLQQYQ